MDMYIDPLCPHPLLPARNVFVCSQEYRFRFPDLRFAHNNRVPEPSSRFYRKIQSENQILIKQNCRKIARRFLDVGKQILSEDIIGEPDP